MSRRLLLSLIIAMVVFGTLNGSVMAKTFVSEYTAPEETTVGEPFEVTFIVEDDGGMLTEDAAMVVTALTSKLEQQLSSLNAEIDGLQKQVTNLSVERDMLQKQIADLQTVQAAQTQDGNSAPWWLGAIAGGAVAAGILGIGYLMTGRRRPIRRHETIPVAS